MIVDVLGLGPSLSEYTTDRCNVTIGVNDIARFHECDFIVIADPINRFTPERRRIIVNSKCVAVVSHYAEWNQHVKNFRHITLAPGRGVLTKLDSSLFVFSNNSPFIATVLAYKLGAKRINLFGVDLTTHPNLGRESMLERAVGDFKKLNDVLRERGVRMHVTRSSALAAFLPDVHR